MIDLHCHILPGVDDGAETMEESIAMAKDAVKEGIETIVATPQHMTSNFYNPNHSIISNVKDLNKKLKEEGIPLDVVYGQEVRMNSEFMSALETEEILSINLKSKYIFIELPSNVVPNYTKNVLYELQIAGYKPIIAHPERNKMLQEQPDLLYHLVKNGAITQITAGSIAGKYGRSAQKLAFKMIESNLAHVVASDARDTKKRKFYMKDAYDKLKKKYGMDMVYQLMENAHVILDGEMVYTDPPERIKMKKGLGIF
ncbi:tyrosine-protein phosphatase [Halobacillus sp. BBL2006]|uniref:tyrosine-protein phosphatase n=1 Tax=Halobacillus sp. BBL2006 TaxID=1543706 RepID=UPI000543A156|nr:CpsB/CapC family capsule biosynthesis tyrosine phosphatase [Halobacillus sp. BBL2006]KHE73179.1 tyrosine protein phosphatase [Halobacillus sp. BBL2006]